MAADPKKAATKKAVAKKTTTKIRRLPKIMPMATKTRRRARMMETKIKMSSTTKKSMTRVILRPFSKSIRGTVEEPCGKGTFVVLYNDELADFKLPARLIIPPMDM